MSQNAAPSGDADPERRVRRGCVGVIVISASALFVVLGQTGFSWATWVLIAILAIAVVGLILVSQEPGNRRR
jgi:hypothetical protein